MSGKFSKEDRTQVKDPFRISEDSDTIYFSNDLIELSFDKKIGAWRTLIDKTSGLTFLSHTPNAYTIDVNIDGKWLNPFAHGKFVRHEVKKNKEGCELRIIATVSALRLTCSYKLKRNTRLVERTATLENIGPSEVKLKGVIFEVPGVKIGDEENYLSAPGSSIRTRIPLSSISDAHIPLDAAPDLGPGVVIVYNDQRNVALSVWGYSETETTFPTVTWTGYKLERYTLSPPEGKGVVLPPACFISHENRVATRLPPGHKVECGSQFIKVISGGLRKALKETREWFTKNGVKPSPDIPEWVKKAIIYEQNLITFDPALISPDVSDWFRRGIIEGPQVARHWEDLAAVTGKLSYLKELGVNVLYLIPFFEFDKIGFNVLSFNISEKVGSPEELRKLVKKAHSLGIRVLGTLVIHGVSINNPIVKAHPEWFERDELGRMFGSHGWGGSYGPDGEYIGTVSFDWAKEGVQNYIINGAISVLKEFNLDGYMVDANSWKEPNWDPSVARASSTELGAMRLMQKLQEKMKEIKPDAILYSENDGLIQHKMCDLTFNYKILAILLRSPFGVKNALQIRQWLEDQKAIYPDGCIKSLFVSQCNFQSAELMFGFHKALALAAMCCFAHGVPMIYSGAEASAESFFSQLFHVRNSLKELYLGDCRYEALDVSDENVFACVRQFDQRIAIPLVNLNDCSVNCNIYLHLEEIPIDEGALYVLYDAFNDQILRKDGEKEGAVKGEELRELRVKLGPYGVRVLLIRKHLDRPYVLYSRGADAILEKAWWEDRGKGKLNILLGGRMGEKATVKINRVGRAPVKVLVDSAESINFSLGGRARRPKSDLLTVDFVFHKDKAELTVLFQAEREEQ